MPEGLTSVSDTAIQLLLREFWSDIFMPQLIESSMLAAVVNRDYDGEIGPGGGTVKVSQMPVPVADVKKVGFGHESFSAKKLEPTQVSITADTVITGAYKFDSLVQLQTQIGQKDSEIRLGLLESLRQALNTYLYSFVAPSTSAPDHDVGSVTDFNAAQLRAVRLLAATAKWRRDKPWYLFADPSYYGDMLADSTLAHGDYVGDDLPALEGRMSRRRYGFDIFEDNSAGLLQHVSAAGAADAALAFSPDFLYLVMQQMPEFKVSDLHANEQHGFLISAKMVVGAKLGIEGNVKHILVR